MGNKNQSQSGGKNALSEKEIASLESKTSFTRDEIITHHQRFLEICPKGEFNKKHFVEYFSSLRPDKDTELFCSQLFDGFDENRSGKVDFGEFLIALNLISDRDVKSKLRFAFKMYDIDNDSRLDIHEIEKIITAMNEFSGKRARPANEPNPKDLAKRLLKKFDRDENGYLTEDEFIDEAITFPTLHALNSFSVLRDGLKTN